MRSSRYGIWVNKSKVGYRRKALLLNSDEIHFTPPNSKSSLLCCIYCGCQEEVFNTVIFVYLCVFVCVRVCFY